MAGPLKATKEQVRQLLKDKAAGYKVKKEEIRRRSYDEMRALARTFAAEMQTTAKGYGYTTNVESTTITVSGQHLEPGLTLNITVR